MGHDLQRIASLLIVQREYFKGLFFRLHSKLNKTEGPEPEGFKCLRFFCVTKAGHVINVSVSFQMSGDCVHTVLLDWCPGRRGFFFLHIGFGFQK